MVKEGYLHQNLSKTRQKGRWLIFPIQKGRWSNNVIQRLSQIHQTKKSDHSHTRCGLEKFTGLLCGAKTRWVRDGGMIPRQCTVGKGESAPDPDNSG